MKKRRSSPATVKDTLFGEYLRGTLSYLALGAVFLTLGWLSDRLEAVPGIQLNPWQMDAPLIVVDAGHGGHDGGAVAGGALEKELALKLALDLRGQLLAHGMRVKMTRESDVFLPLEGRAAIANDLQADAFISLHLNTSANPDVSGIETYFTEHKTLAAQRALQARWKLTSSAVKDLRGRWLAASIQQQLCTLTQAVDRGIKERNYAVVTRTQVPAVLVECGFLTHPDEAAKLKQADYQKQLIQGISTGLRHFLQARQNQPGKGIEALSDPALAATQEEAGAETTAP
ncbi:N-acetylmuramoyl-L-alanine amidase family protein [Prosthecobacter debontii]|uniref:N-acetylmuramoyl-L-alanine amidase family protein n=1 Tax=Prosthecobacter debontii TaxID=48467 RepID=UPI000998FBC7|nr:N-acetylmuramoyl-L-alanine amidase [Prosthecobacter debontii]